MFRLCLSSREGRENGPRQPFERGGFIKWGLVAVGDYTIEVPVEVGGNEADELPVIDEAKGIGVVGRPKSGVAVAFIDEDENGAVFRAEGV